MRRVDCADQPDSSWPSVSGIASIRWVRPVLTTLPSDLRAPVDGRLAGASAPAAVVPARPAAPTPGSRSGITSFELWPRLTWSLGCTGALPARDGQGGDDLVGVHVAGGAGAGLEHVDRELARRARRRPPAAAASRSPRRWSLGSRPEAGVGLGRRGLDQPQGAQEVARHAQCRRSGNSARRAGSGRHTGRRRAPAVRPSCRVRCGSCWPSPAPCVAGADDSAGQPSMPATSVEFAHPRRSPTDVRPHPARPVPARWPLRRQSRRAATDLLRIRPDQGPGAGSRSNGCWPWPTSRASSNSQPLPPTPRRRLRALAERFRRRRRGAGQGNRAHHQPRRQGGRILHQGKARRTMPSWPGAGVRALRLHLRGHQQPQLFADAATRRATTCCCRRWMP